jgi:hypothetical protein
LTRIPRLGTASIIFSRRNIAKELHNVLRLTPSI